jgi:hypothetical protein
VTQMLTYAAVGTQTEVHAYVADFARHADADELMVIHPAPSLDARLRSIELLAGADADLADLNLNSAAEARWTRPRPEQDRGS